MIIVEPMSMRRRDFFKLAGHGLLAPALIGQAPEAPSFTALTTEVARQIPVWLRDARVPGLSMVVFQNPRLAWRRSFGVRDASTNAPVTGATVLRNLLTTDKMQQFLMGSDSAQT